MIAKMTKYSFILLSSETDRFLTDIQELGVVDIKRSTKAIDETSEKMMSEAADIRKAISILSTADYPEATAYNKELPADPIKALTEAISGLEYLKTERINAVAEMEARKPWGDFNKERLMHLRANGLEMMYYCVTKKKYDPEWEKEYVIEHISQVGDMMYFVIPRIKSVAHNFPIAPCKEPEGNWKMAKVIVDDIDKRIHKEEGIIMSLKGLIPELEAKYKNLVSDIDLYLAKSTFESSSEDKITVMEGFAPSELDEELKDKFDSSGVFYLQEAAAVVDNPPIMLKNNRFVKMFEMITDMYGRPSYDGFDPTPYISMFFMLFFAMCMGDAGYGILLIIVGMLLKKAKGLADFAPLVATLGVATTIVGFFLGTCFGIALHSASWVPEGLKNCMIVGNIAGYDVQMLLSIVIGVAHLCIAMTVKAVYTVKNNGFKHSLGTLGWTLLIVGGVIVGAMALLGVINATLTKWIVIVLGVLSAIGIFLLNNINRSPLLNIGSGLWETYNTVTGLLGDVLSYLRLYALGLAGGMLGNAFNNLAGMTLGTDPGIINWVPFVLILVIGHALNLAMCCLGAFVHPLRLNFLEFFKNSGYEGSGDKFNPLKANK